MVPFFFFLRFFLVPLGLKGPADPFRGDAPGPSVGRGEGGVRKGGEVLVYCTDSNML
jgi:hypothetical protein